jgi:Mn-dependent DtxR family transcriptional regulator
LNYSRASVAVALKKLRDDGHIIVDEKNHIILSESGLKIANKVLYRHEVLTKYLIKIGVSALIAEKDACVIEHIISEDTFEAIEKELNK